MSFALVPTRLVRLAVYAGFFFVMASCAGNGCSCVAPIPGGFPKAERHENMIQARVTRGGLDFIEQNASSLINNALPGASASMPGVLTVPPSGCPGGSTRVCCPEDSPAAGCGQIKLTLVPADVPLVLTTANPNVLSFTLHARLQTLHPIKFHSTVTCDLDLDTVASGGPFVELKGDAAFNIQDPGNPQSMLDGTRVDVTNLVINNLDNGDVNLGGGILCAGANLLKGLFIGTLTSQLQTQLTDQINGALCTACAGGTVAECAPWGDACTNKVCMRGGKCVQRLGVEGRMDVGALLASLSPGNVAPMDIADTAGHYAHAQPGATGGLSLGVIGGNHAPVHSTCVPVKAAVPITAIAESPVFATNMSPDAPYPFHVGVGLNEQFLNNAGYAVYDSGGLCLNVGTRSVALLASDTFTVLVGSIKDLTHGVKSPLILSLRPQNPPTMKIGKGTITEDPTTHEKKIMDPLLTVTLKDLAIDFHLMVDERYVRIFTLTADVALPLAIDVDADGKLVPLLGDLGTAFTNLRVTDADLLAESPSEIAAKFPTVLSLALPFLASSLKGFALPSLLGLNLTVKPGGVTGVDGNKFLGLFATLAKAAPDLTPVQTEARVVKLDLPDLEVFRIRDASAYARGPKVMLALGGAGLDGTPRDLEWSFRVDGGFWSLYTSSADVTLMRPEFMLQGHHKVEVRAREKDMPESLDDTPVTLDILIDAMAPDAKLVLDTEHDRLNVVAKDLVSPQDKLMYAVRLHAGDGFGGWSYDVPALDLRAYNPDEVAVRVRDEAGNVTEVTGATAFHGRAPAAAGGGCGSCATGGGSGGRGGLAGLMALALLGGAAVRRRRRRGAELLVGALVVTAAALLAACGGSGSGNHGGGADGGGLDSVRRGAIGRFSDLAASGGRVVASGYEQQFGDLVVAERGSDGKLSYTLVDGVPAGGAVTLDPKGWRKGIEDPGDDVGQYTSIVLDASKKVRVAYKDTTNLSLKYAAEPTSGEPGSTPWSIHVVEAGGASKGDAGRYAGMTLDMAGNPVIAYMVTGVPDGAMGFKNQLKVAHAKSATPAASTDWTLSLIEEMKVSCAGLCASGQQCVTASNTCAAEDLTGCTASCGSGTACVARACTAVTAPPSAIDIADGPGLWAQPVVSSGKVNVVYYYRFADHGELKLATENGAMWTLSKLDADPMNDRGMAPAVAVAADGTLHVAYTDALKDDVYYLSVKPGMAASTPELVDDGERMAERPHMVGAGAAIVLDGAGKPRILYQDQFKVDLLSATKGADMKWVHTDLEKGAAGFGFYTQAVNDAGKLWYSDFVYDGMDDPFGRLDIKTLP